jgi:alkanesulfonate monooxygenase SsuD/methylene tetrahydromethanopterin reductase-like flavin-dependent oxidoreductase (luciferase family)
MSESKKLHLTAFMRPVSLHTGAWRYPGAYPDANFNLTHLKSFIKKLEDAKFDAFFMADHLAVLNMPVEALKRSHTVTSFEPFTLLSALSAVTDKIGLAATASTTYDEPYHIARRFAFAGSSEQRQSGVEHRHHRQSRVREKLRPRRARGA